MTSATVATWRGSPVRPVADAPASSAEMPPASVSATRSDAPNDTLDHREARLRDRVVGRTGVVLGRDRARKRRRHVIAVRAHGAHLAAEQPQLDSESAGDRDDEEERERMHGEGEGHSSLW